MLDLTLTDAVNVCKYVNVPRETFISSLQILDVAMIRTRSEYL